MSEYGPVSVPTGTANAIPEWVRFSFRGSIAGLVVGLCAVFVVALLYGNAIGLSPAACVAVGCSLTVLFSQPAGLAGLVAGAMIGAVVGGIVYHVRHSRLAI